VPRRVISTTASSAKDPGIYAHNPRCAMQLVARITLDLKKMVRP
jgi:hypothetical protein